MLAGRPDARRLALLLALTLLAGLLPPAALTVAAPPFEAGPIVAVKRGPLTIKARQAALTALGDGRTARADRVVVGFQAGVGEAEQEEIHRQAARRAGIGARATKAAGPRAKAVQIDDAAALTAALDAYRADPRVRYAQPDYLRAAVDTPNDPLFTAQWALTTIAAPTAWSVTHGAPPGGSPPVIAVIDSGIYDATSATMDLTDLFPGRDRSGHPDLNGKVVGRRDFSGSEVGADDQCDHGTHVAGIAAAAANNGIGVAGAGYEARLLNVKALEFMVDPAGGEFGCAGEDSTIAAAIQWAADNGANVITMSLAGPEPTGCAGVLQDAVDYAWARGVVVVAAAGNGASSARMAPAGCDHVLAVGASDANDQRLGFSSYGADWVDLAAPGGGILSTVSYPTGGDCADTPPPGVARPGEFYAACSGTSMAAPLVAGAAALVQASCGAASPRAVVDRLAAAAIPIAGTGSAWRHGRLSAAGAVCSSARGGVAGRVYDDANRSGAREPAEAGVGGVAVFADLNGNGAEDDGEPMAVSSGAAGTVGAYALADAPAPLAIICAATTGRARTTARCQNVAVQPAGTRTGVNFGSIATPSNCAAGLIGATIAAIDPAGAPAAFYRPTDLGRAATGGPWPGSRLLVQSWGNSPTTYVQTGETVANALLANVNATTHPQVVVRFAYQKARQAVIAVRAADGQTPLDLGAGWSLPSPVSVGGAFAIFDRNGELHIYNPPTAAGAPAIYQDLFVFTRVTATSGSFSASAASAGKIVNGKLTAITGLCGDAAAGALFTGAGGPRPGATPVDDGPRP